MTFKIERTPNAENAATTNPKTVPGHKFMMRPFNAAICLTMLSEFAADNNI